MVSIEIAPDRPKPEQVSALSGLASDPTLCCADLALSPLLLRTAPHNSQTPCDNTSPFYLEF